MGTRLEAPTREPDAQIGAALAVEGVARRYRRGETAALEALDIAVGGGEVVAVVGPSGCGKSTLLEVVAGLQEPDSGKVSVGGAIDPRERMRRCAHMPQRDLLLPWRDALGNAALALECRGYGRADARRRAAPLFERFGLTDFERARPQELSGGMRQRVAFLRTLLTERPVLLLDEPFASLDAITRATMQRWLADALAEERRTALLVTHDVEEALFLSDRVDVLSPRPGHVIERIDVDLPRPRPRRETVTNASFTRLRERALEALEC